MDLEDKRRRLREYRQQWCGGIKNGPAADLTSLGEVDHCLADHPFPENADEPSTMLELAAKLLRQNRAHAVDEDDIVGRPCRPAISKRSLDHGDVRTDFAQNPFRLVR